MLFIVADSSKLICEKNENRNVKKNGEISKNWIKFQCGNFVHGRTVDTGFIYSRKIPCSDLSATGLTF